MVARTHEGGLKYPILAASSETAVIATTAAKCATFDISIAARELPKIVWALVGKFAWWITRGVVGCVSHSCNFHSKWCRVYSRLVRTNASRRMQIWIKRLMSNPRLCISCSMWLNGRLQYHKHIRGKKHKQIQRRNDEDQGISTTRHRGTPEEKQNRIAEARRRRLGDVPDPYLADKPETQ